MHKKSVLFFAVAVPLLIVSSQFITAPFMDTERFYAESGPLEMVQALTVSIACFVALYLTFKVKSKFLKAWTALAALCCFYVAGEELSWGQWLFNWTTPEHWAAINDQNETNLHNTSAWLDQKPRAILEIGVLIGGLIIPAIRKWKPKRLPMSFSDIYPGNIVVFTAITALFVKVSLVSADFTGFHFFWRASEVMELCLYYFVLLYLADRCRTWRKRELLR